MNEKNKNLITRIVSALVLLPIVVFLLWKGGWWTAALLAGAAGVCASEYFQIVWKKLPPIAWYCIAAAAFLPLLPPLAGRQAFTYGFLVLGMSLLVIWTYHLIRGPLGDAPTLSAHALTGLLYGGLGLMCVGALRPSTMSV